MKGSQLRRLALLGSLLGIFAMSPGGSSVHAACAAASCLPDLSGTGTLIVRAIDAASGGSVPNASARIVPESSALGTGTAGATSSDGLTPPYSFPAPGASSAFQSGTVFWTSVDVTVSAVGYETFVDQGVKILNGQTGTEEAIMVPGSGTFTATTLRRPPSLLTEAVPRHSWRKISPPPAPHRRPPSPPDP